VKVSLGRILKWVVLLRRRISQKFSEPASFLPPDSCQFDFIVMGYTVKIRPEDLCLPDLDQDRLRKVQDIARRRIELTLAEGFEPGPEPSLVSCERCGKQTWGSFPLCFDCFRDELGFRKGLFKSSV
jgi:hypothetical protein